MNSTIQKQTELQDVTLAAPAFHLPNATSSMEGALSRALDFSSEKLSLESPQMGLSMMRQGDRVATEYCHYRLAQEVAATLGSLDDNVQSVSMYDFEATPQDRALGAKPELLPIHLVVKVERKTSALTSLVAALDHALVKDYAEMVGPRRLRHVLDVQVVDSTDIENRRGVASLLYSLHNRPLRLWER